MYVHVHVYVIYLVFFILLFVNFVCVHVYFICLLFIFLPFIINTPLFISLSLSPHLLQSLLAQSDSKQFSFSLPYSSKSSEKLVSKLSSLPLPFLLSHLTVTTFDNGIFTPPSSSSPLDSFSRLITDPSHSIPLPSNSVAVGVYPYDPKKWREEMSTLEGQYFGDSEGERAVLYMDTVTDNSVTPLCPINGMYMCTINVHALCGICGLANIQFYYTSACTY